jgi:hypothetical protein
VLEFYFPEKYPTHRQNLVNCLDFFSTITNKDIIYICFPVSQILLGFTVCLYSQVAWYQSTPLFTFEEALSIIYGCGNSNILEKLPLFGNLFLSPFFRECAVFPLNLVSYIIVGNLETVPYYSRIDPSFFYAHQTAEDI